MALNKNISRILSIVLWSAIGGGLLVLLGAAINYRNNKICKGYKIDISGPRDELFIDTKEIEAILNGSGANKGQGKAIQAFDLRHLETVLEKNIWIKDAQLYFDNNEILRVNVLERDPVARIFAADGSSFYIDSSGARLPLSERVVTKLPVFTGFPAIKGKAHGADSILAGQVCRMSDYIRSDSFWMAQIAQVDIAPDRTFELVPVVGDHVVLFGDGADFVQKFHRLYVFYREVLSRCGFDKYSRIDVEYAGQVVGTKKGSEGTKYDSLQGIKNIQQLIKAARQLQPDTLREQNMRPLEQNTMTEQTLGNYDLVPENGDSAHGSPAGAPVGTVPSPAAAVGSGRPVSPAASGSGKPVSPIGMTRPAGVHNGSNGSASHNNSGNGNKKPATGGRQESHGGGQLKPGVTSGQHKPAAIGQQQPRAVMPARQ